MILNLRGMKESIRILIPLFLGFAHSFWRNLGWDLFHVNNLSSILP